MSNRSLIIESEDQTGRDEIAAAGIVLPREAGA